jgi:hypothetical protein
VAHPVVRALESTGDCVVVRNGRTEGGGGNERWKDLQATSATSRSVALLSPLL